MSPVVAAAELAHHAEEASHLDGLMLAPGAAVGPDACIPAPAAPVVVERAAVSYYDKSKAGVTSLYDAMHVACASTGLYVGHGWPKAPFTLTARRRHLALVLMKDRFAHFVNWHPKCHDLPHEGQNR